MRTSNKTSAVESGEGRGIGVPRRAYVWISDAHGFPCPDGRVITSSRMVMGMKGVQTTWGGPAALLVRRGGPDDALPSDAMTVEPALLPFGLFVVDYADEYALASSIVDAGMVLISAATEEKRIRRMCQRMNVSCATEARPVTAGTEAVA